MYYATIVYIPSIFQKEHSGLKSKRVDSLAKPHGRMHGFLNGEAQKKPEDDQVKKKFQNMLILALEVPNPATTHAHIIYYLYFII